MRRVIQRFSGYQDGSARLPIIGLGDGIGFFPSDRTVCITYDDTESREGLLGLLHADLIKNGVNATWLCTEHRVPAFLAGGKRGHHKVIVWNDNAAAETSALGPTRLMEELLTCGLHTNDLLIVDALDPWLVQAQEDQGLEAIVISAMRQIVRLRQLHNGPVLALAPSHRRGVSLLPLLASAVRDYLASWHASGQSARLDVFRWGQALRTSAHDTGLSYLLQTTPSGRWMAAEPQVLAHAEHLAAPDLDEVFTLPSSLRDADHTPAGWTVCTSATELKHACGRAVAATVVLSFERLEQIPELAQLIFRLRTDHPHLLRIIVRETGEALRRNGNLVVRRLGANAVLGRNQSFAALLELIHKLRDETYTQQPASDPAQLLKRLAPDPVRGYLAPNTFADVVTQMIDRTSDTPLEHVLIHMPLLDHVRPSTALAACQLRRNGDVITADASGVYLFLFACPAEDALDALASVFTVPCSELAKHLVVDPDLRSQRTTLDELHTNACDQDPILSIYTPTHSAPPSFIQPTTLPTLSEHPPRSLAASILALRENNLPE